MGASVPERSAGLTSVFYAETMSTTAPTVWQKIDRTDALRVGFVVLCAVLVFAGLRWPAPVPAVAVIGLGVGLWPILTEAWQDIRGRRMSMELSMLIAIVAAAAIGEWTTALVITVFVLAAEILEDLALERGRGALTSLMEFLPDDVQVRRDGHIRTLPLDQLAEGDTVIVTPGERIAVDGVVTAGESTADQASITGESVPVDLVPGSEVFAGSINQVGALEVRAEKVGADSSYGRIVTAVQDAQEQAPPVQRLADRLASYLVYLALGGAVITFLITQDPRSTIAVIIVAGACGVAAGTPLAVLAAIARIARTGAFVKGGAHLEALSEVDVVAFDKTGTLTTGTPRVVGLRPADGVSEKHLLLTAASAEQFSEHPLAAPIVDLARKLGIALMPADDFEYRVGSGIAARINGHEVTVGSRRLIPDAPRVVRDQGEATAVHVAVDGRCIGTVLLADTIRDSAKTMISELTRRGIRTLIITGDTEPTARAVARELGITDVRAELLPHEKLEVIRQEREAGHRLAMIGDGVNDSPALAHAHVGVAMGSGTGVAQESADVILISSDLHDLARTVAIAKRARAIVMANFIGTIAVDVIGIVLAGFGLLSPVAAAVIHVGSETVFILNSARLIPGRASKHELKESPKEEGPGSGPDGGAGADADDAARGGSGSGKAFGLLPKRPKRTPGITV